MISSLLFFFDLSTRQTLLAWFLFLLMGLIIVGFSVFIGYKAFKPKANKKNDI